MSHFQPCCSEEGRKQVFLAFCPGHGGQEGLFEVLKVVGSEVRQVPMLGVTPDCLDRIEVWGVSWQPLDDKPPALSKPDFDPRCPMRLSSVPDERKAMGQMSPQTLKEAQNLPAANVVGVLSPVETVSRPTWSNGDGTDGGDPITTIPLTKDRRLASGRPGAPHNRLKHEAALIEKDHASSGSLGVFLYGASVLPAISEWRLRLAPGRSVPVSDNSIPRHAGSSRREQGGSELQRYAR
jgi:hypothetical protein